METTIFLSLCTVRKVIEKELAQELPVMGTGAGMMKEFLILAAVQVPVRPTELAAQLHSDVRSGCACLL